MKKNLPPLHRPVSTTKVVNGYIFAFVWIIVHVFWFMGTLMANVMQVSAYDPSGGQLTNTEAGVVIFGMIIGQIVSALAAIPGGEAFYQPNRRKRLLRQFAGLFLAGALIQVGAITGALNPIAAIIEFAT